MRSSRVVAIALLIGLAIAACGARLDPQTRQAAANAVLNAGGSGTGTGPATGTGPGGGPVTGTGPGTTPGGGVGTGPTGVGGNQPGTGSGTGATGPGNTGGSGNGPAATGSSCPKSGTDVGLTSNSVTVGTIASTTGPVSGLFQGAQQGMQAYRAFIDSQGGICGHILTDKFADDGTNCGQNQNDTEDLAKSVFAFVGSFSLYDGCSAAYISQHNIPDLHVQLDPKAGQPSSHFDIEPGPLGYATGPFAYYAHKLGSAVKSVGTLYPNIPSAAAKQQGFVHSAESQGWHFVYTRAADAQESDWLNDFVTMCQQKHIRIFFTSAENAANAAKMIQDEKQANCPSSLVNIIPIAYDQAFVQDVNPKDIEGLMGWNEYSLFFNKDEARRIPELAQFQAWWARANGGAPLNLYGLFAWAESRLFQQAFENAGPTINRQTLLAALHKIHTYDDHGAVSPVDPTSKSQGPGCYILWRFHNGAFERMDDPATGYRCDGRFLPLNG